MQITIEVKGIHEAIAKLQKMGKTAKNLTPIHCHIGNILQNAIEESFEKRHHPLATHGKSLKKQWQVLIPLQTITCYNAI